MESDVGYVIGIDVGSSFVKCQIFDKLGNIKSESSKEVFKKSCIVIKYYAILDRDVFTRRWSLRNGSQKALD